MTTTSSKGYKHLRSMWGDYSSIFILSSLFLFIYLFGGCRYLVICCRKENGTLWLTGPCATQLCSGSKWHRNHKTEASFSAAFFCGAAGSSGGIHLWFLWHKSLETSLSLVRLAKSVSWNFESLTCESALTTCFCEPLVNVFWHLLVRLRLIYSSALYKKSQLGTH